MHRSRIYFLCFVYCLLASCYAMAQGQSQDFNELIKNFQQPPAPAKPWVFWYWMNGAVSKAGITADLEAMKSVGIGGAYLMTIKDTSSAIPFQPTVRQLTPGWWSMVNFAMQEAKRLGLQLAMHVSDGFALAGGPWITPELSMQKVVWTKTYVTGGKKIVRMLDQPETNEGYYKDIAVFAYPANFSFEHPIPHVSASDGTQPHFLAMRNKKREQRFNCDSACWVQYEYNEPFTCRSIEINSGGNNYQAQRMLLEVSDDGIKYRLVGHLDAPRSGWQDGDEYYTHAMAPITAKYFRFSFNKEGSEPGAEDLDAAKWKPTLKLQGIYLSNEPVINEYETKNGSVWRIANQTNSEQVNPKDAIPLKGLIDLTPKMEATGGLVWEVPPGDWVITRMGHTSTGHTNATGGAAKGLECDKFNATAIKLQFNNWFAKAFEKTDPGLAQQVLKIFHVDSWECGSQNWSDNFRAEFQKRRGYDIMPWLPVMAGVPIEDASTSEKVLHDIRQTIAELVNDVFYVTLNKLAHEKGCQFTAESVAPTMVSDGMLHYKTVDIPMGEFWLNSPTHDKPNDMRDAVSGAHVYGKNIIQAEAFTTVRMDWSENPGMLKTLGDRNFAIGANRMVVHVFVHNPFTDRKPGMTLDGVGLYYQRDQTWFPQSKAWIDYLARCQSILQMGKPVVDIAVFTGEEVPRRSVLPERLVDVMPLVVGKERMMKERKRLLNEGVPMRQKPDGVTNSANITDPLDWIDPLNGYSYDSFNPDALMMMKVNNGRIELPGGASYKLLVFPAPNSMNPTPHVMSLPVARKILELLKGGALIMMDTTILGGVGLKDNEVELKKTVAEIKSVGKKGNLLTIPFLDVDFTKQGIQKDLEVKGSDNTLAWTHRKTKEMDIYFLVNQSNSQKRYFIRCRSNKGSHDIFDPVTGSLADNAPTDKEGWIVIDLPPSASTFLLFSVHSNPVQNSFWNANMTVDLFNHPWAVNFSKNHPGSLLLVMMDTLKSWTSLTDQTLKYFSGTALYSNAFNLDTVSNKSKRWYLEFDSVYDIASVKINDIDCGTVWTEPYLLEITNAIKNGKNKIEIEVSNTWHNRLIGDSFLPENERTTWTNAPFRLKGKPLLPSGIFGNIVLVGTK